MVEVSKKLKVSAISAKQNQKRLSLELQRNSETFAQEEDPIRKSALSAEQLQILYAYWLQN